MTPPENAPKYRIWADGQVALELTVAPGPLVSVSSPPPAPDQAVPTHPWATATFLRPEHEGTLGRLLREAPDLDAFLAAVAAAGYTIEQVVDDVRPPFPIFQRTSAISEDTIARFAERVPAAVVRAWRTHGAGVVGLDGFFRFVDPARSAEMLEGVLALPEGAVVLFTTGLGDVIAHVNGVYLVVKARWGAIDVIQDRSFEELVRLVLDPAHRDAEWEWQPYPAAARRDGKPGIEQCFGFVPLLALGGAPRAENLQLGGLYEHLAVIAELAGQPQVRRILSFADDAPLAV